MTKLEWIQQQIAQGVTNFSVLNTPELVANPVPQGQVPKPVSILEFAANLSPNDRRLLQNEYAYRSLLTNINKGDLSSIQADLQNLTTTPSISQDAITILNSTLTATTETMPDPNWQSNVYLSPAQQAGFDVVSLQDWIEANT